MKPATMRYFDAIHSQLDAAASLKANHWEYSMVDVLGASAVLQRASPYFLDGDIQEWLRGSIDSFPSDVCIGDVLTPSERGWLLFERPIPNPRATTDEEQIAKWFTEEPPATDISFGWGALAWSTIDHRRASHLVHCPYHDPDKTKQPSLSVIERTNARGGWVIRCESGCPKDDVVKALKEIGFGMDFRNISDKISDEPPVVTLDYYHKTSNKGWALCTTQSWPFHKSFHGLDTDDRTCPEFSAEFPMFVISLFAFMNQPFSTVESRRLPRANRRRLQRETGIEDPNVNVISLRRAQHTNGQSKGGTREWSSRWLVKGHWRSQYYPSKQKNSPLWIMPYVKGPQDKPLKSRNDIALFHVTR